MPDPIWHPAHRSRGEKPLRKTSGHFKRWSKKILQNCRPLWRRKMPLGDRPRTSSIRPSMKILPAFVCIAMASTAIADFSDRFAA